MLILQENKINMKIINCINFSTFYFFLEYILDKYVSILKYFLLITSLFWRKLIPLLKHKVLYF